MKRDESGRLLIGSKAKSPDVREKIEKMKESSRRASAFESEEDAIERLYKYHYFHPKALARSAEALDDLEYRIVSVMLSIMKEGETKHIGADRIAKLVGRSVNKIRKTLEILEAKNLIMKEKKRRQNAEGVYCKYTIRRLRDWWEETGKGLKKTYRDDKLAKFSKKRK